MNQTTLTRKSILAAACFCFATSLTAQAAGRPESTSLKDTSSAQEPQIVASLSHPVSAAEMNTPAPATQMVVTILPGATPAGDVKPGDLEVYQGTSRRVVTGVERLSGERAGMELFIYLDRSIDSVLLNAIVPELAHFIRALPETTGVAVGDSIGNQTFTADREKAVAALMQPPRKSAATGTWSNLLDLIRQWPGNDQADRRAVLIITAGVSPEYAGSTTNEPYAEAAWRNAQIAGIGMYSILVPGGNEGQSTLAKVTNATGGRLYTALEGSHCSLRPFLDDVNLQLDNQYRITFEPKKRAGAQVVRVETDMAGERVIAPSGIYVRRNLTTMGESASAGD